MDTQQTGTIRNRFEPKRRVYEEIAAYVFEHPEVPFAKVGEKYGVHPKTVNRIAKRAGLAARKPGRKPQKKPTTEVLGRGCSRGKPVSNKDRGAGFVLSPAPSSVLPGANPEPDPK
jgi:hypothetical protein